MLCFLKYEYSKVLLCSQMCTLGLQKMHEGALKICCMCSSQDLTSWTVLSKHHASLICQFIFLSVAQMPYVFFGAIPILYVRWQ